MIETLIWLVIYALILFAVAGGLSWIVRTAPFIREDLKPNLIWGIWAITVLIGLLLLAKFANDGGLRRVGDAALPAIERVG